MNQFMGLKRTTQLSQILFKLIVSGKSLNLQRHPIDFFIRTTHSAQISDSEGNPNANSRNFTRIARAARIEAQNAFMDYLHSTRSYQFIDAEHVSRNSPIFLQSLIEKVDNDQEIGRSLTRFLRYHPINEFEPFFESLGLKESEFSSFLPRNLMFLSDDPLLLDNFHVLYNYGIPCGKIGRIYKGNTEIFRYDHGVLASKLSDYEKLSLSKTTVGKLVTCCPSILTGGVDGKLVKFLEELKSFGFEYDWIGGCLSEKNVYDWNKMLGLMGFLDKTGWSKKEIGVLIKKHSGFLIDGLGKRGHKLIGMFLKLGFAMDEILSLFLQFPRGNFMKNLLQGIHFLVSVEMEIEDIVNVVRNHSHVLGSRSLKKPNSLLTELNIGKKRLCAIVREDPNRITDWYFGSKTNPMPSSGEDERSLEQKTLFLLKLGFFKNSEEMRKALKAFRGKGNELQERFDCLVKAGLDRRDVSNMIRLSPHVLNQSCDVLEKKMGFLVNNLGYPLESLITFPSYLSYTIERVKLRFSMYNWLKEEGKAKPMLSLSTILASSDSVFIKSHVKQHPKGPEVWESFKKALYSS